MIDEIWVFGSYVHGSLTPGDVDLEVIITPDDRYHYDEVRAFSGYRHPRVDLLREIRGKVLTRTSRAQNDRSSVPCALRSGLRSSGCQSSKAK